MRDCDEQCTVHRFRAREKKPANSRFAGKYFLTCPVHGRMGGDAKDSKLQAFIEHHAKLDGAAAAPKDTASLAAGGVPPSAAAPSNAEKKSKSAADAAPDEPAPAARKSFWGW